MKWLDQYSWTSVENADSIMIEVIRDRGSLSPLTGSLVIFVLFFLGYQQGNWLWALIGALGTGSIIADRLNGDRTGLTVTKSEFVVQGNLARGSNGRFRMNTVGLISLIYYRGGRHTPSGLYAIRKNSQTCLIRSLNEQQSNEIALLIYKRFPDLETGDTNSDTLLFGKKAELTSLNLSKPRE
jgi:hypothetical protein